MEQLTFEKIKALIGERKPTANKGDNGRALIWSGRELMSGAALMCAAAALRAGVGMLKAVVPNGARQAFYSVPECMCIAFGGEKWNELDESFIAPYIAEANALCVGPGMGKDNGVENTVRLALAAKKPIVIDADGLNALSRIENIANMLHDKAVLTPHIGEMVRLTGLSTAYIKENQAEVAAKYAKRWGCTVLLKSYRSVIACHDGRDRAEHKRQQRPCKGRQRGCAQRNNACYAEPRAGYVRRGVCGRVYAWGQARKRRWRC